MSTDSAAGPAEPRYGLLVKSYAPAIPQWPQDLTLSIAAIADIHFGEPYMGIGRLQTIIETTNRAKPDLIVLLGDYVATHHGGDRHKEAAAVLLALPLSCPPRWASSPSSAITTGQTTMTLSCVVRVQ